MIKLLGLLLFSNLVMALPQKIEIIFLSPQSSSFYKKFINEEFTFSKKITMNMDNCLPMGDGCFHPQFGLIEKEDLVKDAPKIPAGSKTINSLETDMIKCDKNASYFDIFCGKAGKISYGEDVEVWIDTSSSMRSVDFSSDFTYCGRRSFIENLKEGCPETKLTVSTFDTGKQMVGDHSGLCINKGLNDVKKLKMWINSSEAKLLVLITDVGELSREFKEFLDSVGANYRGGDETFTIKELVPYADSIVKKCKAI